MATWFRRILRLGDTGPDVDVLQRKLKSVSGVYDEATAAKVRGVQKANDLPMTGEVDEDTASAIGSSARSGLVPEWYERPLRFGHHGRDVRALRRMLSLPDGETFNGSVELALRRYQSRNGIYPDGILTEREATLLGDEVPLDPSTS